MECYDLALPPRACAGDSNPTRTTLSMSQRFLRAAIFAAALIPGVHAYAEDAPAAASTIEAAVAKVKPALVRIDVVDTYYAEGREQKQDASGSGVVISTEGHIVTNHHVAGHAKLLKCTFDNKEEIEAELVGTDPMTDISVIKLKGVEGRKFPVVSFGDSDLVKVGDQVLAMGSPLALSQSVTLGIISNSQMTLPDWVTRGGGLEQDGEDVGSLVRWLGHDAEIHPGNSGGPLVNLSGEIIGINEIKLGLSGAIPGNLVRRVAETIIKSGSVERAWLGLSMQPRLKSDPSKQGALVGGAMKDGPAEKAGLKAGDLIIAVNDSPIDVQFDVQLPLFNAVVAALPVGQPAKLKILRDGKEQTLDVIAEKREPIERKQAELKQWGLTVRDLSLMMAKEMKRDSKDGVLITSVRPGGPAGDAKPDVKATDVIVSMNGKPVRNVAELRQFTDEITKDAKDPVSVLTGFERKNAQFVTVVKVGIKELEDPGLEVKKAWLPVETQVITRDIAQGLGQPDLTGFRVTKVYAGSTAEKAGVKVGDLILAVDNEKMTASQPEHYEELGALIRQYSAGTKAELTLRRGADQLKLPVELVRAPKLSREMKKYDDENFEFTVRDITFFDKSDESWKEEQRGVLVDTVRPGGWADLGHLASDDLLLNIDGKETVDVETTMKIMNDIVAAKPKTVVLKVLRGIHTMFIELEPRWEAK